VPGWRVHRALVLLAAREVGLPRGLIEGLLDGSVEPDEIPDKMIIERVRYRIRRRTVVPTVRTYFKRVRHHGGAPWELVEYYYNLACFYRARGDLYSAGRVLGRAAHYVQDAVVRAEGWLHDKVEAEMERFVGSLPHICLRPIGGAATLLCETYGDTVQLFKHFVSEPVVDRETGRSLLWKGQLKKWSVVLVLVFAPVVFVFAASAWNPLALLVGLFAMFLLFPVFAAGVYLALRWIPGEYVAAMRAGVHRVEPPAYVTAMK